MCRYGVPRSLHSDQGRNFESVLFQELCRLLEINKTRTSPYRPQSDGLIERFNKTLLSMLSLFVDKNQQNWDSLLPYVMMAYRSSVHATTGFTPYKVVFGKEMVLPVDVMLNVNLEETFESPSDYVQRMAETLSTVVGAVQQHQLQASSQQKKYSDFRAQVQYYSVGELVWVRNKARKKGVCFKLQRNYKGPFKVIERLSDVLYQLQSTEGGVAIVVHYNRLKPYVSRFVSERLEGSDESEQSSLQQPVDQSILQLVPPVGSEGRHIDGHPCPLGEKGGPLRQGSSVSSAQEPESSLDCSPGPVSGSADNGVDLTRSAEMPRPVRQRKLPVWVKDYHLDSRTRSSELEGE